MKRIDGIEYDAESTKIKNDTAEAQENYVQEHTDFGGEE